MAKSKNQRIYSTPEHLQMLAEEQDKFIGREYKLDLANGVLIIYALPRRHKKSPKSKEDKKEARNKRAESAQRRS